jgi:hypothetical protein
MTLTVDFRFFLVEVYPTVIARADAYRWKTTRSVEQLVASRSVGVSEKQSVSRRRIYCTDMYSHS